VSHDLKAGSKHTVGGEKDHFEEHRSGIQKYIEVEKQFE
jgi:hypothetical protein